MKKKGQLRTFLVALSFLAPALVALILFRLLPAGLSLLESLKFRGHFVGLGNYQFLIGMPDFLNSIKVTLLFNVIINPLQTAVALALAALLTQRLYAASIFRLVIFTPIAIPLSISSLVWGVAFRPDDGLLNAFLSAVGIGKQPFLTSQSQALASIMVLATWVGSGLWMMFFIAGLGDIPQTYYDAAKVDGAGWWRTFFGITLPMLRRTIAFVLVADTVSNFILFPPMQILTQGGPNNSTDVLMYEIYRQAYTFGDTSLAFAEVVVLLVIMLLFVMLQFRLLRTDE